MMDPTSNTEEWGVERGLQTEAPLWRSEPSRWKLKEQKSTTNSTASTRGFPWLHRFVYSAPRSRILFLFVNVVLTHLDSLISSLPCPPVPVVVSQKFYHVSPVCFSLRVDPFGPLNAYSCSSFWCLSLQLSPAGVDVRRFEHSNALERNFSLTHFLSSCCLLLFFAKLMTKNSWSVILSLCRKDLKKNMWLHLCWDHEVKRWTPEQIH